MVKVSVILGSSRPGGLDITLPALAKQTYQDFEVVFVDGRYHKRHAQVLDYVKEIGLKQPFFHMPNHRYNGIWPTTCAGFNTEFMLSEGELLLMIVDFAYMKPDWIEQHIKYHDRPRLLVSPHKYAPLPPIKTKEGFVPEKFFWPMAYDPNTVGDLRKKIKNQFEQFDEITIFKDGPFDPSWCDIYKPFPSGQTDPKTDLPEGPLDYRWMHTKNESFPLDKALAIGGMDEWYDRGKGPGDLEFGFRLWKAGCDIYLAHSPAVQCFNPREYFIALRGTLPEDWNGFSHEPYKMSFWEGVAYMDKRIKEMNEGNPPIAPNPYDIWEKRDELWKWRELSQQRETVIPYNNIEDDKYWPT